MAFHHTARFVQRRMLFGVSDISLEHLKIVSQPRQ
jgi:hypothetical protein